MNAIEILALIFAILILVKLIVIAVHPKGWLNFAKGMTKNTALFTVVYLALAVLVGYYVFSAMSIVNVAAVMLFTSLLIGVAWAPHMKKLLKMRKELTTHMFRRYGLSILIWAVFAIIVLIVLFL